MSGRRRTSSRACRHLRLVYITAASATVEAPQIAGKGVDLWNKSYYPTGLDASSLNKAWFMVDAEGQTLGRLATLVATTIR